MIQDGEREAETLAARIEAFLVERRVLSDHNADINERLRRGETVMMGAAPVAPVEYGWELLAEAAATLALQAEMSADSLREVRARAEALLPGEGVPGGSVAALARDVIALTDSVARLVVERDAAEAELREKKNELAVAYGGGSSPAEQEWFSELDRVKAQRDAAERALEELARYVDAYESAREPPVLSVATQDVLRRGR